MMKQGTTLKEQFKDRLIEWSQAKLGTHFDALNNLQRSRQMISFFVTEVLEKLIPGVVPDDDGELESSIVDGSGDGGADLIYRNDEGQVLIIQAKYRGKDGTESAESVGRFCDLLERLYLSTERTQQSLNADVLELAGQIDWSHDYFRLYYLTTAKAGQSVSDRVLQGVTFFQQAPGLEDRHEFNFLDQTGLNKALRDAVASADFSDKPIVIPMLLDANNNAWCHYEGPDRDMYVGEVNGAVLANILQMHKASLFTMNIRDYVGDTKTNKDIITTALNKPAQFEYFNNGVTAVAGKIMPNPEKQTLTCEKLSIINGAQTVRSLSAAVTRTGGSQYRPVSSVRVMLRLMSFRYPSEVGFVSEVTRYNNTQNAIKVSDFRSNDETQKDLSRRFGNLNLNGRSFEYKNKRSVKRRNSIAITMEELTKSIFAFRFGPDDFYGGSAKLFDASESGLYTRLYPNPESPLSEAEFALIAGTYFLCEELKMLWESRRKELRSEKKAMHPSLERKGLLFFCAGELLRQSYGKLAVLLNEDLSKLVKVNLWANQKDGSVQTVAPKLFDIGSMVLIQQYDNRKSSDPNFKHRNWFRDDKTLASIKEGVGFPLQFGLLPRLWH